MNKSKILQACLVIALTVFVLFQFVTREMTAAYLESVRWGLLGLVVVLSVLYARDHDRQTGEHVTAFLVKMLGLLILCYGLFKWRGLV
ncbi:hypothetical protein O6R05_00160 [Peptoniphilus equinus]|uniref:Uncharacterized protein n=1 Tax=Peptoniphilus equinus TaxID=3016343 RepID=A0ABY7QT93_9FIRM|nr:hypothetical protein [Peptoniphilus equinus]WBW50015.1 hypothetical protein O6R05_00160 [Peptoniphilus equinus]